MAKWLQRRGWYVIPSYDYSGADGKKPPRMLGNLVGYAIPDLDVARFGKRLWVEVKTKGNATLYRKTGTLEHGISHRLLNHYLTVQAITGTAVWLFVHEEKADVLLVATLATLGAPRTYEGWKMGQGGMAFWPRDRFKPLGEWP